MNGTLDQRDLHLASPVDFQFVASEARNLNKTPTDWMLWLNVVGRVRESPWEFPRDSLILKQEAEIEQVYLILSGMVTVGLYPEDAPAQRLYVSGPGTVVDMCALLNPPVSPVSTYVLTNVQALAISRAAFVEALHQEPDLVSETLQTLCTRLSLMVQVTLKGFFQDSPALTQLPVR